MPSGAINRSIPERSIHRSIARDARIAVLRIFRLLEALDSYDASWHACAVGFIRSKSRSQELCWGA